MPTIGGANIGWDSSSPPDTESAGLGDDRIRSMKSSIQQAMDAEHNFPTGGGSNTGYHVMGSARPYYGAQSLVSSSGSDARLMQTSDTSRLFGVGSGGTVFLGGPTVMSAGSFPGGAPPQRYYWAMEFGNGQTAASGNTTIVIPNSGFSGVPFTTVSMSGINVDLSFVRIMKVHGKTATSFQVADFTNVSSLGGGTLFDWISIGSRVL